MIDASNFLFGAAATLAHHSGRVQLSHADAFYWRLSLGEQRRVAEVALFRVLILNDVLLGAESFHSAFSFTLYGCSLAYSSVVFTVMPPKNGRNMDGRLDSNMLVSVVVQLNTVVCLCMSVIVSDSSLRVVRVVLLFG